MYKVRGTVWTIFGEMVDRKEEVPSKKLQIEDRRSQRGGACTTCALFRVVHDAHAQRLAEACKVFFGNCSFPSTPPTYSKPVYMVSFLV